MGNYFRPEKRRVQIDDFNLNTVKQNMFNFIPLEFITLIFVVYLGKREFE